MFEIEPKNVCVTITKLLSRSFSSISEHTIHNFVRGVLQCLILRFLADRAINNLSPTSCGRMAERDSNLHRSLRMSHLMLEVQSNDFSFFDVRLRAVDLDMDTVDFKIWGRLATFQNSSDWT
ncbi:MAG: hypothetical protein R3A47_06070, partial [Polyangiales bacterium]